MTELGAVTLNGSGEGRAEELTTYHLRVAPNGSGGWAATSSADALEV